LCCAITSEIVTLPSPIDPTTSFSRRQHRSTTISFTLLSSRDLNIIPLSPTPSFPKPWLSALSQILRHLETRTVVTYSQAYTYSISMKPFAPTPQQPNPPPRFNTPRSTRFSNANLRAKRTSHRYTCLIPCLRDCRRHNKRNQYRMGVRSGWELESG